MTFAKFMSLSIEEIQALTGMVEIASSPETFNVTFPTDVILEYYGSHLSPGKRKWARRVFRSSEQWAKYCQDKLHRTLEKCIVKLLDMLRGYAFGIKIPELTEKKLAAYEGLYSVVTNNASERTLVQFHQARAEAEAHRK